MWAISHQSIRSRWFYLTTSSNWNPHSLTIWSSSRTWGAPSKYLWLLAYQLVWVSLWHFSCHHLNLTRRWLLIRTDQQSPNSNSTSMDTRVSWNVMPCIGPDLDFLSRWLKCQWRWLSVSKQYQSHSSAVGWLALSRLNSWDWDLSLAHFCKPVVL